MPPGIELLFNFLNLHGPLTLKEKWRDGNQNVRKPSSLVPICHTNNISWEVHILNLLVLKV